MLGLAIRGAADVAVEARRRRREDEQDRAIAAARRHLDELDATIAGLPTDHWAREDGSAWRGLSVAEVARAEGRGEVEHWTAAVNAMTTNPILSPFDEAYARYRAGAALLASRGRETRAAARDVVRPEPPEPEGDRARVAAMLAHRWSGRIG